MNKYTTSMFFLLLAIFISLSLGSYKFLVSNKPASLPFFVENFKEGAAAAAQQKKKASVKSSGGNSAAPIANGRAAVSGNSVANKRPAAVASGNPIANVKSAAPAASMRAAAAASVAAKQSKKA